MAHDPEISKPTQIVGAKFTVSRWEDQIIHIVWHRNAYVTVTDARHVLAAVDGVAYSLTGRRVIVDLSQLDGTEPEAREFFAQKGKERRTAANALIVGSGLSRTLGNFFMMINRPIFPTRLFTNFEKAAQWVRNQSVPSGAELIHHDITFALANYAQNRFDSRLKLEQMPEEWREIASAINMMAEELQSREKKREIDRQNESKRTAEMANVGKISASLAHEVGNPLTIIKGLAQSCLRMVEQGTLESERLKKKLQKIELTTDRIGTIIETTRRYTRDSSRDPFERVAVKNIIEDSLKFCHAKRGKIKITQGEFPDSLVVRVREIQLSQVIVNLINNAHDAIKDSQAGWIQLDAHSDELWVYIKVTDSGDGIPENLREKIMEPFFTTKGVKDGTGLGLSLSKKIIKDFGGDLYLDAENKHTCFVIKLPHSNEQMKAA